MDRDKKKKYQSNYDEEEEKKKRLVELKKKVNKKGGGDSELTQSLLTLDDRKRSEPKSYFGHKKNMVNHNRNQQDDDESSSVSSIGERQKNGNESSLQLPKEGYKWDFVFVLPCCESEDNNEGDNQFVLPHTVPEKEEGDKTLTALEPMEIVQLLHDGGLETYIFKSVQEDELIVKIRAPLERLMVQADMNGYRMQYSEKEIDSLVEDGVLKPGAEEDDYLIKPVHINDKPEVTFLRPYEFIYGEFSYDHLKLFANAEGYEHPFSGSHRMKLIVSILQESAENGGCGFNLKKLEADKSLLAYYPLHMERVIDYLESQWLPLRVHPWNLPIDHIREYFGEKIGIYFNFLGFYTTWLIPLSVAGLCTFLETILRVLGLGQTYGEAVDKGYVIPMFSLFTSVWSQLFLEYWKREEVTKAMEWGQTEFEEEESERPDFEGDFETSHIDGQRRRFFPEALRSKRKLHSNIVICSLIALVISLVSLIFYVKFVMTVQSNDPGVNEMGSTVASIANAIQIQVMNAIYSDVAIKLNERENHRTDTDFEDSLIAKFFAFQFVNSYASFFYVAFFKGLIGDPCTGTCMSELSTSIGIIFMSRLIVGNIQEVAMPVIMGRITRFKESQATKTETPEEQVKRERAEANLSRAEFQYTMENYDASMGLIEDYAELAIQYGYVTLFVSAFPLAPVLSLLSNIVEIRTDGWKLLHAYRRPLPLGAEDIGTWFSIFQTITFAAIVTNAALIVFTMDIVDVDNQGKVWLFALYQYLNFGLSVLLANVVDDTPEEVDVQLQRQAFIDDKVKQILNRVPDDEEHKGGGVGLDINDLVRERDDEPPMKEKKYL